MPLRRFEEARHWLAGRRVPVAGADAKPVDQSIAIRERRDANAQAAAAMGLRWSVDRLLVVPGFGAFLRGWFVSPQRRMAPTSLRIGRQILQIEEGFPTFHDRPELSSLEGIPDSAALLATAGFTAVFRGEVSEAATGHQSLKFTDESSRNSNVPIDSESTRICESSEGLDEIAAICPALTHEVFFDEFVNCFSAIVRRKAARVAPIRLHKLRRALIVSLPSAIDDVLLTFDCLRTFGGDFPPDVGIAIVCSDLHNRAHVLSLVADLQATLSRPVALLKLDDPVYALWSMPALLACLDCDMFWFIAPNVMPTSNGWREAAEKFAQQRPGLELFGDGTAAGGGMRAPGALSFAWSTTRLTTWERTAPFYLGGFYRDNGLPKGETRPGTIRYLADGRRAEAIERCDARLFEKRERRPAARAE